jgi:pyridoxine kinase
LKKAAVINDLSGFGNCSLTAAIPVLSALGVQCCPVATAVLTGQTGYADFSCTDLTAMMPEYTDCWRKNQVHFDAIYSGYMTDDIQISHLMDFLAHFHEPDTLLLVDPVMGDNGHTYKIFSPELLAGMRQLAQKADLITPNLTEACLLAGKNPDIVSECSDGDAGLSLARELAQSLRSSALTQQDVVITGIRCSGDAPSDSNVSCICNVAATADGIYECRSRLFARSYSGTGDLFASVLCGCRLNGMTTADAIDLAVRFLSLGIADALREDVPGNDGIHFEKHLITLIQATQGGTNYE